MILQVLANHMYETRRGIKLDPPLRENMAPVGAIALACCAVRVSASDHVFHSSNLVIKVERAISFWKTGEFMEQKGDRLKTSEKKKISLKNSFSGDNYASRCRVYINLIEKLKEKQWDKMMEAAEEVCEKMILADYHNSDSENDYTSEASASGPLQASELIDLDEDSD